MGMFVLGLVLLTGGVAVVVVVKGRRSLGLIAVVAACVCFGLASVRTVDPGEVAVPVAFGSAGAPLGPGVQFVPPWTDLTSLTTRTQEYTMTANINVQEGAMSGDDSIEVKGLDGATGRVDATLLFHLNESDATRLFKETGTDYVQKVVRTGTRTCVRDAFSQRNMVDAATSARGDVEQFTSECLRATIEPRGLTIESFNLRGVRVDDTVQKAIDAKVAAQQNAEQKQFELQASRQDAERKRIEAQAVSDGQQIIKCGAKVAVNEQGQSVVTPLSGNECQNQLTTEYLQWFYVDSLSKLVGADNNTVIVMPFDQNLTPLLNIDGNGRPTVAPPTTAAP